MEAEKDFSLLLKPLYISLIKIDDSPLYSSKPYDSNLNKNCVPKERSKVSKKPKSNILPVQYLCSYPGCNKLFGKNSRLVVHERTHTGERPFKCPHESCQRSYTRQFHLTRHIDVSHTSVPQNPKEPLKCGKCDKQFTNIYSMTKHQNRFHNCERYTCKECGQIFKKQQHLKTHSFSHTGIKPFKCDYAGCERRFSVPSLLKRHALSHLQGRYLCPYDECALRLNTYKDLRHHLSNDHTKTCDHCGKEFNMICRLRTHLASHQNVREAFFCPYNLCERYYFEEKNLRNHICSKHDKNFKGFECPICDKWLVTKQKLKLHLNSHSLNPPPKVSKKPKQRKPRKDKGTSRTDFAKLLSGYSSNEEGNCQEMTCLTPL